ncbi:MAG: ThuA domain-containing protein [Opitutaceae bacterium]|nr:ThuA domain-containing protein [Verrucomicrobiales bacterium]
MNSQDLSRSINARCLIITLIVLASSAFNSIAAQPLKALIVCGGCCHDFEAQKKILSEGIGKRANVQFTIVHEGGDDRNFEVSIYKNKDWARGYDVIVHNECFGAVTNNALIENIASAHQAGVPAVMLHCSTHSYRAATTDEWRKTLGLSSYSHEKNRDLVVKNLKPTHPVMIGFPEVWNDPADELYKNDKIWPNLVPLAQAYGQDTKKDHVCIWLNTYGKGRVFATTLGHGNNTMQSDVYLDLVTRGLLWVCDQLDDSGKPKPGYEAVKN